MDVLSCVNECKLCSEFIKLLPSKDLHTCHLSITLLVLIHHIFFCLIACTSPIDIIFGLPTSTRMTPSEFTDVKDFTKSAVDLLEINNRLAHVSFIPYSDGAEQIIKLDSLYSKRDLKGVVDRIQQAGSGYNVEEAITRAAASGFTIFGGTRPTAPKILVLLVSESTSSDNAVLSAAEKLKSQGVKLITVKIGNKINNNAFQLASSQPSSKHFFDARSFSDISDFTREAIDSACKGKKEDNGTY